MSEGGYSPKPEVEGEPVEEKPIPVKVEDAAVVPLSAPALRVAVDKRSAFILLSDMVRSRPFTIESF